MRTAVRNFAPASAIFRKNGKCDNVPDDVGFRLYWIPFLSEAKTPTKTLTDRWEEDHKQLAGALLFPQADPDSDEAILFAILAAEMGANPGNWIHDKQDTIRESATEFGTARKLAYQISQAGRGALEPDVCRAVFSTGSIGPELANELRRRRSPKQR